MRSPFFFYFSYFAAFNCLYRFFCPFPQSKEQDFYLSESGRLCAAAVVRPSVVSIPFAAVPDVSESVLNSAAMVLPHDFPDAAAVHNSAAIFLYRRAACVV